MDIIEFEFILKPILSYVSFLTRSFHSPVA